MNLIIEHLREFNREYLSTPMERRLFRENLLGFALTVAVIIATGVALELWIW